MGGLGTEKRPPNRAERCRTRATVRAAAVRGLVFLRLLVERPAVEVRESPGMRWCDAQWHCHTRLHTAVPCSLLCVTVCTGIVVAQIEHIVNRT